MTGTGEHSITAAYVQIVLKLNKLLKPGIPLTMG
jgi:hypothetical protein